MTMDNVINQRLHRTEITHVLVKAWRYNLKYGVIPWFEKNGHCRRTAARR